MTQGFQINVVPGVANGFAITKKVSDAKGITKLSDLTKLGSSITLAAASDCPDRPECALGLKSVYGVTVSKVEPLGFGLYTEPSPDARHLRRFGALLKEVVREGGDTK